jgi:putative peptide zinc metalloprotease protein
MNKDFLPIIKENIEFTKLKDGLYLITDEDNEPVKVSSFGKYIIDLINNQRTINDIFLLIENDYQNIKLEQLYKFISQLIENSLIINVDTKNKKEKSIWRKLSFIKLIFFKSDKYYKYFSELLNGKIVLILIFISLSLIIFSIFHFLISDLKFIPSISDYYSLKNKFFLFYPFFILIIFIKTFLHESSHAIICRYFGQKVRKMGLALYLLHPVFFTDTTNIWKENNKFKRIFVSLAGPISDLNFLSILYLINIYLIDDSLIYNALIFLIYFGIIKAILNLNPFIKLDGYYILMDLLEIPNLRKKSFKYLKESILRKNNDKNISKKRRLLFYLFGIFSSIMTFVFVLSFILYLLYHILNVNIIG